MRVFATVIFLGVFLVLIGTPAKVLARVTTTLAPPGPHEEYQECGTWCENTCANPHAEEEACILMCKRGNFCVDGYIKETPNGRCIPPAECPRPDFSSPRSI